VGHAIAIGALGTDLHWLAFTSAIFLLSSSSVTRLPVLSTRYPSLSTARNQSVAVGNESGGGRDIPTASVGGLGN